MSEHQNQQQENNENKESISRFEKMLQSKSSSFFDVDEFERIIDHYLDNLNYNYASQAIKIAIRQHPESMHLKIKKAQLHIIKEQPMEALAVLKQIDDQSGTNFDLVFLKGNAFNQLGQYDSAIVCFNELLGQPLSDVPNVLFRISVSFINQGQYDLALLYLQKGLELDPYDINLLFESAFCHQQKEEFDRSIEFYNRYLDEYPFNDIVWINLAIAYNELEQFDKASDACDYAIALDEKFGMAWFHKANAFAGKQEFEQAIVFYSQCLSCDTEEDAEVHCCIAECYEKLGINEKSTEHYKRSLEIDEEFADSWYGLSVLSYNKAEYEDSLKYIKKALYINSANPDYWYSLGNIYGKTNDTPKAVEAYNKAVELNPGDYEAWINLSELYYKQNHLSKAIKTINDAYKHNEDVAIINYRLAAYYYLKGEPKLGLKFFRKGTELSFAEHTEFFKICPDASEFDEIKEILNQNNK